jgi:hypothetical protein
MHGSKKWIRDWRGRLKRSQHRTQQDWKGELATSASASSHIGGHRYLNKGYKCPQCTYLNKNRPILGWNIRENLGKVVVPWGFGVFSDHPTYKTLRERYGWGVHADRGEEREWFTKAGFRHGQTTWHFYRYHTVYRLEDTLRATEVRALQYPPITCDPCRRKDNVSWRWWHTGGEAQTRYGRYYTEDRRQEQRERRAEYRNLMHRARQDPELYDYIPTKYKNQWLD